MCRTSLALSLKTEGKSVVSKAPLLSNMPHLGTTDINVFSGICFSTYFTVQVILSRFAGFEAKVDLPCFWQQPRWLTRFLRGHPSKCC